jgi:hypothetical protein
MIAPRCRADGHAISANKAELIAIADSVAARR